MVLELRNVMSFRGLYSWVMVMHKKLSGKEYSKGDSRYAARDAGVVAVEGITAVLEGPASLLAM